MSKGNQIMTSLLFNIESNTAELKKGLEEANGQVKGFTDKISSIKNAIVGAFAVTAVIGFGKKVFDIANEIDDVIGKIDDLGNSMNLALDAGKAKAIADTFGVDIDKVISAANSSAKQFGISFTESLNYIQKGLSLAGTEQQKYLKSLESSAGAYSTAGGNAEQFFTIVTDGYRTGSEFEKQLKEGVTDIGKTWNDLTGEMNEGQLVQQKLIEATAAFNAELATLFDGTGDTVDEFKANVYELGVKAFQTVKKAIVDTINYFIDLYNESLLFRGAIQYIVLTFQTLWETVKLVFNLIVNGFKATGKLIGAILKGEFSSIPDIIKENFTSSFSDIKTFAVNVGEDFVTAVQSTIRSNKIELISDSDVDNSVNKIVKGVEKIKDKLSSGLNFGKSTEQRVSTDEPITSLVKSPNLSVKGQPKMFDIKPYIKDTEELNSVWQGFGTTISETLMKTGVDALTLFGDALTGLFSGTKTGFKDMVVSMLDGLRQIVNGLLIQAIAGIISKETSTKGIVGLATAAVGIAAVTALFKSKVPKFESGGIMNSSGLAMVGERGAELVSLPAGARVYNNRQTNQILSNSSGININITSMIRGEDLYFAYNEVSRKRGY